MASFTTDIGHLQPLFGIATTSCHWTHNGSNNALLLSIRYILNCLATVAAKNISLFYLAVNSYYSTCVSLLLFCFQPLFFVWYNLTPLATSETLLVFRLNSSFNGSYLGFSRTCE